MSFEVWSLAKGAASAMVCVFLAACEPVENTSTATSFLDSRAAKAHELREGIDLLNDVCLREPVTFSGAITSANEYGLGLFLNSNKVASGFIGTPDLHVRTAVPVSEAVLTANDPSRLTSAPEFKRYRCSIVFRAPWADQLVGVIEKKLIENGFQKVRPFQREVLVANSGGEAVNHIGVFRRNGVNYGIAVQHAEGSSRQQRNVITEYISGTRVLIDSLGVN